MNCLIKRNSNNKLAEVLAENGQPSILYKSILTFIKSNNVEVDGYVQQALDAGKILNLNDDEHALALWSKVYTDEFKSWSNNVAKDENGEPLLLLHVTNENFNEFSSKYFSEDIRKQLGAGFFFSNRPLTHIKGNITMPVFLSLGSEMGKLSTFDNDNVGQIKKANPDITYLKGKDFGQEGEGDVYVVFNQNQIKSIFNTGEFSDKANIYYSKNNESKETESELETKLKSFLNKIGIDAQKIDDYKEHVTKFGNTFTVNGFADLLNKVVKYDRTSLPEETAHIAVALHVNTNNSILEQVTKTELYKQKHAEYMNIYKDEQKVRREILGQLVAQKMIANNNEGINSRLGVRIKRLWDKFVSWLKGTAELQDFIQELAADITDENIDKFNDEATDKETYYAVYKTFKEIDESDLTKQEKLLNSAIVTLKQRLKKLEEKKVSPIKEKVLEDQIIALEIELERNEAEVGIDMMLKYFNVDSEDALKYINAVKTGGESLSSNQLVQLKEFIDYYYPILTDMRQAMNRGDLADNGRYKIVKDELDRFDAIYDYYKDVYKLSAEKFLGTEIGKTTGTDMNMGEYLFGSLRDVGDDIARRVHFQINKILKSTQNVMYDVGKDLLSFISTKGSFNTSKFRERDSKGKKTHFFLSPHKLGDFYNNYDDFITKLKKKFNVDSYPTGLKERTEWNKVINEWKKENEERRFVPEYYDLFNNLSIDAKLALDQYNAQIAALLLTVTDENNNVNFDQLSDDDYRILEELEASRKGLSNSYYITGIKKDGTDLEIAIELKTLYSKLKGKLESSKFSEKFKKLARIKKAELSKEDYDKWVDRTTQIEYSKEFYRQLEQIDKRQYGKIYDELNEEKNELLKIYRNSELEVNVDLIPQNIKDRIFEIETELMKIRNEAPKTNSTGLKFGDIATIEETQAYKDAYKKMKAGGKDAYDKWFKENHVINKRGYSQPLSFWTKLVPKNKKQIIRTNKRYWAETSKDSLWYNNNYDESWVGRQPSKKWKNEAFDNLTKEEKEILTELIRIKNEADGIYKLSDRAYYQLPQISKTGLDVITDENRLSNLKELIDEAFTDKVQDDMFGEIGIRIDGSQIKYIPKRYIHQLDNPDFITDDLASSVIKYRSAAEKYKQMGIASPDVQLVMDALRNRQYIGKRKSLPGSETTVFKAIGGFIDQHLFGVGIEPVGHFTILGKRFNTSKILTKVNNFVRHKNLVFNLFTSAAAYTTAALNSKLEDLVGTYSDQRSKNFAIKEYIKNVHAMLAESGKVQKTNRLSLVLEKLHVLGDDPFDNLDKGRLLRLGDKLPYSSYEVPNHGLKAKVALAMMYHFRLVDGELTTKKKYGDGFDKLPTLYSMFEIKNNKAVTTIPDDVLIELQLKIEFITNRIDGLLSPTDKAHAHRHGILQLVTTHKGWLWRMTQDRFKSKGQNYITNEYEEGYYKTYWRFLRDTFLRPDRIRVLKNMMAQWNTLEDWEKVAVKRTLYEIGMMIAVGVMAALINAAADDDDDDDYSLQLMAYISNRTLLEMSAFPSILIMPPIAGIELSTLLNSPIAATSILDSMVDVMYLLDTDLIESGTYKDLTRYQKALIKITPGLRGAYQARNPKGMNQFLKSRSMKWLY